MDIKKDFVDLKLAGEYGNRWACTDDELDLLYVAFEEGYRSSDIIAFLDDINYHKEARFFEAHEYFRGCGEYDGIAADMSELLDGEEDVGMIERSIVRRTAETVCRGVRNGFRRVRNINSKRGIR